MKKLLIFLVMFIASVVHSDVFFRNSGNAVMGGFGGAISAKSLASNPTPPAPSRPQFALLRDVKAANTSGGTCNTSAYTQRALTEETIAQDWVSISSNQFTLTPGVYLIEAWSPSYYSGNAQSILYNVTSAAIASYGTSVYTQNVSTSLQVTVFSRIQDVVDIGSNTTYEIRHRCLTANADSLGIASNFGVEEVYTIVSIRRLAD